MPTLTNAEKKQLVQELLLEFQQVLDVVDDELHAMLLPHVTITWNYLNNKSRAQHLLKSSKRLDSEAKRRDEASFERYAIKSLANICLVPHAPETARLARHY